MKVLGNTKLSYLELEVVLFEVKNTLNSRPLTYIYEDLSEEPLTPSHFLHNRRLSHLSSNVYFESDFANHDKLSKRFSYVTHKLIHFWIKWTGEYLADLREMHRLQKREPVENKLGDIVLISDESRKRGFWKMGIVEEEIIGWDGWNHLWNKGSSDRCRLARTLKQAFTKIVSIRTVSWE